MLARRTFCTLALALPAAMAPPAWAVAETAEKKKAGGTSYIQLQTLSATVFRPNGQRGVLTLEVGVDVPDPALRALANASQPRLRAAYVQFLQIYAAGLAPGAPPDADYIARSLQAQTNQVLRRPGARLLLGSIMTE